MNANEFRNRQLSDHAEEIILNALSENDSNPALDATYVRGFVDAYLGRPYDDGIHPRHGNLICIPLDGDAYRKGWLDAKRAL